MKRKITAQDKIHHINKSDLAIDCGFIITEPGIYILPESLSIDGPIGICIQAEQVTFDLNGFTLSALSYTTIPVSVAQSSSVTIKNGIIAGGQGVAVTASEGITLEDLEVIYPVGTGVSFSGVTTGKIHDCIIRNGTLAGVWIDAASTNFAISNTAVYDCQGNGFDLQGCRIM